MNHALLLIAAGALAGGSPKADLVVTPRGEIPSLAAAVAKARDLRARGELPADRAIEIAVAPGRYHVSEPIRLTPADSGLHFTGAGWDSSVIDGGVEIGPFAEGADGVWEAKAPAGFVFEQLWVGDRRATRARTPNEGAFFYMREQDDASPRGTFYADPADLKTLAALKSAELKRVQVAYWQSWDMGYAAVRAVDCASGRVETARNAGRILFFWDKTCPRYVFENYRAALDAPGEWFLDAETSTLFYRPRAGERPETARAFAPVTETILKIEGDVGKGAYVKDVSFTGLGFAFTKLAIGPDGLANAQSASNVKTAAVLAEGADGLVFRNCRIAHTGAHGVWIRGGSVRSTIEHTLVEDLGAGGVYFGGGKRELKNLERNSSFLTLRDSIVRHGGRILNGAVGVWLGQVNDCRVVHNEIADFLYTGVSMGWNWGYMETTTRRNHVDFNHIHHIQQGRLSDGGAFYSLGNQAGSTVCNNWVHDVNGYRDNGSPAWGLYTDEGSAHILLASNLVERCRSGAIHQHYGTENTYANNIFATFDEFGVWRSRAEDHVTIRVTNNVFWWTNAAARAYRTHAKGPVKDLPADGNVYWCASGAPAKDAFNFDTWEAWRKGGRDAHGAIADPLFADPAHGDWTLKPGSPALKAGFRPFDWRRAGVLKDDPAWVAKAAERTWDEFRDAARAPVYRRERAHVDFEGLNPGVLQGSMGSLAPLADSQGRAGTIEVVDRDVAEGKRALRFTELPGLPHSFVPMVDLKCRFVDGIARLRFAVKGDRTCNVNFEARDYDTFADFGTGAVMNLRGESFSAGGREVCTVPAGTWAEVDVALTLSGPEKGSWSCTVTPRGGAPKTVRLDRFANAKFSHLTWIGFISYGPEKSSWCLDDIRIWKESASAAPAGDERIHRAVAAAADGATVRVAPGVYRIGRPIVVPEGKAVKIVGEDPLRTIVDAGGRTNAFVFLSRGANELKGLTVRNGRGAPCLAGDETYYAGGVTMRGGLIADCRVLDCETLSPTKALGGGIATWGGVRDTLVSNCAARVRREHNGGTHPLVCSGGGMLLYGGPGADGCTVVGCVAEALRPGPAVGGYGGGVEIFGDTPLRNSTVRGCRASMGGGGVHLNSGGHVLGCRIVSNEVAVAWRWDPVNVGGGVAAGAASNGSRIERTRFVGNRIAELDAREAPCGGGGLGAEGCRDVTVADCTFEDNVGFNGGAAYFNGAHARVSRCTLAGNRALRFGPNFASTLKAEPACTDSRADEGPIVERPRLFNRDTDWMAGKIGIFQHRLYGKCPEAIEAMRRVDPKAMAAQLAEIGADYFCITLNQCGASFLAPNDAYEDISGVAHGTVCNPRDIPMELADALAKRNIRLMLYSTGTPPRDDVRGVEAIGYSARGPGRDPHYTARGVRNWAKVFGFWSRRYGARISGWWIDGCYADIGFDADGNGASACFARALKEGNPHAVVTFNPGIRLAPHSPYEDYICGEINEPFFETCAGRWVDGRQWHLLTYTYSPLGFPQPIRYTDGEWIDWLGPVLANGGAVTIDGMADGTGCLLAAPAAQLKRVIAAVRGRLDPNGADARKIAAENAIRRKTDAVEAANINVEHGRKKFFKRGYAKAACVPDRARVRKGPGGEEIWSDAIQAALDEYGGVCLPPRPVPYVIDRPIVLKGGQSIWMGVDISPLRSSHRALVRAVPGVKGPLLVNAARGDRDIFVRGVNFEGVANPVAFRGVEGLVVRDLGLFGCSGTGVTLEGVTAFRVDGVAVLAADGSSVTPERAVAADRASADGLVRNVTGESAGRTRSALLGTNIWHE